MQELGHRRSVPYDPTNILSTAGTAGVGAISTAGFLRPVRDVGHSFKYGLFERFALCTRYDGSQGLAADDWLL